MKSFKILRLLLLMIIGAWLLPEPVHSQNGSCPSDIISYWKFDESAAPFIDSIGSNNATCTNCPVPVTGIVNGAQKFNATTSVDVPDNNTFDWGVNDSFSIEFWAKGIPGQTCASSTEVIIGREDSGGLHWWIGCNNTGAAKFRLNDKSGYGPSASLTGPFINDGNWHHIVGVRDGTLGRNILYVDGQMVDWQSTTYSSGFDSLSALNIGHLSNSYHFAGTIDEIALYNRALSETEIQQHYQYGTSGTGYCGLVVHTITAIAGSGGSISPSGTITVNHGSDQTFTITPNSGYQIADVKVDGSSIGPVTAHTFANVTSDHTIEATFSLIQYTLTVTKSGTGTGTVNASGCTLNWIGNTGTCTVSSGTSITLSGTADPYSTFTGWSGGTGSASSCTGTGNCSFNITQDSGVTATFTLNQYTLTVSKSGTGIGTVSSSPAGISCGDDCSETFNSNTVVTLTASPSSGSIFIGWSGDCSGTNQTVQITMSSDKNCIANFTGLYYISGRVLVRNGWTYRPLPDVNIYLSGSVTATTSTDTNGNFIINGVPNGSFTITPSMSGYSFTPISRTVSVNGGNITNQNFMATYTGSNNGYSISGIIKAQDGSTLSGVLVNLTGANVGSVMTGSDGSYTFTGLVNGSYTITPSKAGYTFSPSSRNVTISGSNITGQDFVGTYNPGNYSISGLVRERVGWKYVPIAGVTVILNDDPNKAVTTDSYGRYTFTGITNGTYIIRPTKTGYIFNPVTRSVTVSGANRSNINFVGIRQ